MKRKCSLRMKMNKGITRPKKKDSKYSLLPECQRIFLRLEIRDSR